MSRISNQQMKGTASHATLCWHPCFTSIETEQQLKVLTGAINRAAETLEKGMELHKGLRPPPALHSDSIWK